MAGVGFELKKLFRARTAAGKLKAYSWSLIITTGPFVLLASMVLFIQLLFAWLAVPESQSDLFIGTTVYAFIFSQLLASGFVAVQSRYLADCLSEKKYGDMTASLFGVQAILLVLGALAGLIFYAGSPLPWPDQLLGYLFFSELLLIWSQGVYLTAVRRFKNLIWGYLAGAGIGVAVAAVLLFQTALPAGRCATLGVVCGLGVIVLSLYLSIFAYFGLPGQGRVALFGPPLARLPGGLLLFPGSFFAQPPHLAGTVESGDGRNVPLCAGLRCHYVLCLYFHSSLADHVCRIGRNGVL